MRSSIAVERDVLLCHAADNGGVGRTIEQEFIDDVALLFGEGGDLASVSTLRWCGWNVQVTRRRCFGNDLSTVLGGHKAVESSWWVVQGPKWIVFLP